ncbi:phosphatase PAP2 family protein [Clostridium subterminale]|uniref:Phosphatase PAP2 family protein n=1 Tax=Clostridium subterminale TaxID=1550 RepID=A0ABP3W5Z4_CLOSU
MKWLLEKYNVKTIRPYLWIFSIGIISICYFLINHFQNQKLHSLYTEIDDLIPFISVFIIPYMMYMPNLIISLIIMCYCDEERYFISLLTLNIVNCICLMIYLNFQTYVSRPIITHDDLLCNFVKSIYCRDNPYNCFPSIHVAATFSALKGINKLKNMPTKYKIGFNVVGWLIIISTQFVKQHVIIDLLAGLVLVEAVYKFIEYLFYNTSYLRGFIKNKSNDDKVEAFK